MVHLMALLDRLDGFSLAEKRVITVPLLRQMLAEESPRHERLALFDLDGTLIPSDSDHAFGEFMVQPGLGRRRSPPPAQRCLLSRSTRPVALDIDAYVAFATAPWRARSDAEQAAASSASSPR
jgi:hypothetical protein